MNFRVFQEKVRSLIKRSGASVHFKNDEENGIYYANCSDGVTIIGSPATLRVKVRWGSGHVSTTTL